MLPLQTSCQKKSMMEILPDQYNFSEFEKEVYQFWLSNDYFSSTPDERKPFTIVIPPPNVTGVLHMGHMLNNTIQDVLIRRARMKGFNACWVPGTDHASIATEAKVVQKLKSEGKTKHDIGREEFLNEAWKWTHEHGGIILEQLKKLGCSCDWNRTKFTMDDDMSESVKKVFVDLYNKGLIYRGYRMINWDPEAKTNISDEEVIYEERHGKLYFLKYKIEDSEYFLTIATTRPETIFGDVAVCVHPEDERYKTLIGKKVQVPIANRWVPVIADDYVDREFGTGVLKITPSHDPADYELGLKHHLPHLNIFTDEAKLNENGLHYAGLDRFEVRKRIEKELEEKGLLEKTQNYVNKVGTSERTKCVIEPRLSIQWFLRMEELAKPALKVVEERKLKFFPDRFVNTYKHWMENIKDWNISRQLWWGHQIPAYYYGSGDDDFVVAMTKEEALALAQKKSGNPNLTIEDLKQDPDVLDTWFSSWLWPISVFNGVLEPDNSEISYYYPTQDLVTGPDIIFFWVARMIMAGLELRKDIPFENVYFTGIVRDKQRRKMSKSLGNSPDPLELIEKYGADGVRVGLLLSAAAGNDLLFDEALCLQGRNFGNKIWNSYRLLTLMKTDAKEMTQEQIEVVKWMHHRINASLQVIEDHFSKFRISDALHEIYSLIWDDFCSWYLEFIKPAYGQSISQQLIDETIQIFEKLLKLLHPFMPFITEKLWQSIQNRTTDEALIISTFPTFEDFDQTIIDKFELAKDIVSSIRAIRQEKHIPLKNSLDVVFNTPEQVPYQPFIQKMANIIIEKKEATHSGISFRVQTLEGLVMYEESKEDLSKEAEKLKKELEHLEKFKLSIEKKLSNEKFIQSAPAQVIELERKKFSDSDEKIAIIKNRLAQININI